MEKLKFVALQSIVEPGFWNRMTKERDSYMNLYVGFFRWNHHLSYKVKNMSVSRSKPAVTKAWPRWIWRRSKSKYTSGAGHIKVISLNLIFNLRELTKKLILSQIFAIQVQVCSVVDFFIFPQPRIQFKQQLVSNFIPKKSENFRFLWNKVWSQPDHKYDIR